MIGSRRGPRVLDFTISSTDPSVAQVVRVFFFHLNKLPEYTLTHGASNATFRGTPESLSLVFLCSLVVRR